MIDTRAIAAATEMVWPGIRIGARRDGSPIYRHAGGNDGDITAGDDDGDDTDADDDDEPDDKPADDWKAPTKAEWEAMQSSKSKANKEAAQRRRWLQEHGIDPRTGKKADADADGDDHDDTPPAPKKTAVTGPTPADVRKAAAIAAERAAAKAEARLKPALAKTAVKAALGDAGWSGGTLDRVMKMIDLDEVDVDDDGNVTGIEDQVAGIKADLPELFRGTKTATDPAPKKRSAGAREVDGGDKKTKPANEDKSWLAQMEAQYQGGA